MKIGDIIRFTKFIHFTREIVWTRIIHIHQSGKFDIQVVYGNRAGRTDGGFSPGGCECCTYSFIPADEVPDYIWTAIALFELTGSFEQ